MFVLDLPTTSQIYLVLYLVTLVMHVVVMNYVLAGAIYLAAVAVGEVLGRGKSRGDAIANRLRDWMPFALGIAITLGVAPLLFVQMLYKLQFYTANLLLFHRWMAILPVLIVAFYMLYLQKTKWIADRPKTRAGATLLVALAFVFVAWSWSENHLLSLVSKEGWANQYGAGRWMYRTWELVPRLSLWLVGSFPMMATLVAWQLRTTDPELVAADSPIVRRLAKLAIGGGLGAVAIGIAYAFVLPPVVQTALTTTDNVLCAAVVAGSLAVVLLAWASMHKSGGICGRALVFATLALVVAKLGTSVLREVRRYVGMVSSGHWSETVDRMAESGHLQGLAVFLFFFLLNAVLIVGVCVLIRRSLRRAA